MQTLQEELRNFVDFPNTFELTQSILQGEKVKDGVYSSVNLDNSPWNSTRFFRVKDNQIVALGQELGREGGWYWFDKTKS